ncbi:MAG: homoserine dehydrogenase [Dehalococcoidia bacterium]
MANQDEIQIALLGIGVIGSAVARTLLEKGPGYARQLGLQLNLRHVLERDLYKADNVPLDRRLVTDDPRAVLDDEAVDIVIELLGGERPAYDFIKEALSSGRYVVTANKEVMAKHGRELLALAHERGVDILFEASVGSGTPVIAPLRRDLWANEITSIRAIINGTTNYILTRMSKEGLDFEEALRQAQALGYAEAEPSNDLEGIDAAYKLAILASLAFHTDVSPDAVYREGITALDARDFRYARELGYGIKLLAVAKREEEGVDARVHPAFVPKGELLANVDGVLNAVQVEGDLLGRVLFQGPGAGPLPTTSAIMADVMEAAHSVAAARAGRKGDRLPWRPGQPLPMKPVAELATRYYLRMEVADRPGVLAQIARCFGDNGVSIASVIQKETDEVAQTAELVIMTHVAREESVQKTIAEAGKLAVVTRIGNLLRVES